MALPGPSIKLSIYWLVFVDCITLLDCIIIPNLTLQFHFHVLRFARFGVRVLVTFHLVFVHIIFVRFRLLSGHLLGKSCSLGLTICSLCTLTICNFGYFSFWF